MVRSLVQYHALDCQKGIDLDYVPFMFWLPAAPGVAGEDIAAIAAVVAAVTATQAIAMMMTPFLVLC